MSCISNNANSVLIKCKNGGDSGRSWKLEERRREWGGAHLELGSACLRLAWRGVAMRGCGMAIGQRSDHAGWGRPWPSVWLEFIRLCPQQPWVLAFSATAHGAVHFHLDKPSSRLGTSESNGCPTNLALHRVSYHERITWDKIKS
jgi:hypothetical protein